MLRRTVCSTTGAPAQYPRRDIHVGKRVCRNLPFSGRNNRGRIANNCKRLLFAFDRVMPHDGIGLFHSIIFFI